MTSVPKSIPRKNGRQTPVGGAADVARPASVAGRRLQGVDALRGFVMVLMLLDHVRETWFLHVAMPDPVDARTMMPAMYLARLAVSLCAPVFVALTGLAAYLFHTTHSRAETTAFLLKRGLVLMAIEMLYLSPIYWGIAAPTLWLQVIWCIGLCMIMLAALIRLPRAVLVGLGVAIVCGHNLLDGVRVEPGHPLFVIWSQLHQRESILLPFDLVAKIRYPVLPWIGVIALGYGIGPWFLPAVGAPMRRRRLLMLGSGMIAAFLILRGLNVYGDAPWYVVDGDAMRTAMSVFALTKYPPSLLFLLLTLGVGALLLAWFETGPDTRPPSRLSSTLAVFGGAPMFFYVFHLGLLRLLYHVALAIWGPNQGAYFALDHYGWVLVWYVALIVPVYWPTVWFAQLKARRRDIAWLRYF